MTMCEPWELKEKKNFEKETGMRSRHTAKNMIGREQETRRNEKLELVLLRCGATVISCHIMCSCSCHSIYILIYIYMLIPSE